MDFPTPVKDQYTGLDVTTTGCQVVNGTTALQLVRSRHLYYMNSNGYWEYDGLSDFSRIQRQDAFFRAVLAKVNASITSPLTINSFIGAAVGNLTIDDTLSRGRPVAHRRRLPGPAVVAPRDRDPADDGVRHRRAGPTCSKEAQPYAQNMINAFNAIGSTADHARQGSQADEHQRPPPRRSPPRRTARWASTC